jgi:biotin transport system substrate-specific component
MLNLAKISFCIVLLVFAFLSQIPLFGFDFSNAQFTSFLYSPALLIVFILSCIFRNNYAFISLICILIGVLFGLPLFSFGGGWRYIFEPSFGYIIAMIVMSVMVFYHCYHSEDKENLYRNALLSLFLANLFGVVYFIFTNRMDFIPVNIFVTQVIFDLVFAMIFLWLFKRNQEII